MVKNLTRLSLLAVCLTAVIVAQSPVAPHLDLPALESYIRHVLMWPSGIDVKLGDPTPAPMPGLYRIAVRGTAGGRSQDEVFYVSADGQNVIHGEVYDVRKSPFQADLGLLKTEDQPFLGTPGAPVTVVEFSDFQCPYCKQESAIVRKNLMEAYPHDIQLYYVDFPLESIHPFARGAAVLGRCIYRQNSTSFWAYHDWIFEHQGEITPENLREKAMAFAGGDKNLDTKQLTECAVAAAPREEVDRNKAIGDSLRINSTPTFFVNGRRLVGTIALADWKMVVEHEIAYAKTLKKEADCCSIQLALPGMGKPPAK